jgi:uncharacterized protein
VNEYLYQLRLIPRLESDDAWTEADQAILSRHVEHLGRLLEEGTLILAGRTLGDGEERFGIAIFRAPSDEEARRIMESDPAIAEGVMTARLYPYRVAFGEGRVS